MSENKTALSLPTLATIQDRFWNTFYITTGGIISVWQLFQRNTMMPTCDFFSQVFYGKQIRHRWLKQATTLVTLLQIHTENKLLFVAVENNSYIEFLRRLSLTKKAQVQQSGNWAYFHYISMN